MTDDRLFERVREILAKTLSLPKDRIDSQTRMRSVQQWDSINHLTVILEIEKEFRIRFTPSELLDLESVEALVTAVERHKS